MRWPYYCSPSLYNFIFFYITLTANSINKNHAEQEDDELDDVEDSEMREEIEDKDDRSKWNHLEYKM